MNSSPNDPSRWWDVDPFKPDSLFYRTKANGTEPDQVLQNAVPGQVLHCLEIKNENSYFSKKYSSNG